MTSRLHATDIDVGPAVAPRVLPRAAWQGALAIGGLSALWMLWSVWVAQLPAAGLRLSPNQLSWLAAAPALSGTTVRLLGALPMPWLGAYRWRAMALATCLFPLVALAVAARQPDVSFETLLALSLTCGLGAALLVDTTQGWLALQPIPFIGTSMAVRAAIALDRQAQRLCLLSLGSLGSVFGLAAGVPLLLAQPSAAATGAALPIGGADLLWTGPALVAAGWWLGHRHARGATVVLAFAVQALAALAAGLALTGPGARMPVLLLASLAVLASASGAGAAAVLRLPLEAFPDADRAIAALGLCSAVATFGGFAMPKALGTSLAATGGQAAAFFTFFLFYVACSVVARRPVGRAALRSH